MGFEPIHRCPWSQDVGRALEALWLVGQYPQALPCSGGICDQPASFIEMVRLCKSAETQLKREDEGVSDGE